MPTAQFLLGKISSGKLFAIPPWDKMVKYPPSPRKWLRKQGYKNSPAQKKKERGNFLNINC